ncbi:MAG: biotin-dependent carboxyltransferase family protein [Halobacteriota archaeon]|uniref:5-oxoprolinase subunit C family protein n=1 Tax=Natronomonas sp. TaxID=2184060 RepID=UPI0039755D12
MLHVTEGGLSTTVQDTGRFGNYHIGMPPSGAVDQYAHRVGNFLVGNEAEAATLEMTYTGPTIEFDEDALIAVCGADMSPELDGEAVPMWTAVGVDAGQTLDLQFATEGARAYLAVAGGVDVDQVMGSRATYTLIGIGGYEGRGLEAGDELPIGDASVDGWEGATVDDAFIPDYGDDDPIRVVMGLCDYRLTDEGRDVLLGTEWKISDEADRVGYRLDADVDIQGMFREREQPFGAGTDPTNVVDLGYPIGSIQMAGQPIVLMRDAVTGGGYATVGTVISPDRGTLAQGRSHETVTLKSVSVDEALAAREAWNDRLETLRDRLLD